MWVEAQFLNGEAEPEPVQVTVLGTDLVIKRGGEEIRWLMSSLVQSGEERGSVILRRLPGTERIEIRDAAVLGKVRWAKKLPLARHTSLSFHGGYWILGAAALAVSVAYFLPILSGLVPWRIEKAVFRHLQPYSETDFCTGADSELRDLLARLYPIEPSDAEFPLDVHIVSDKQVNAFAVPGGKIYILDGFLKQAESPEEVAGVLAHEIEHVRQRHVMRSIMSALFTSALFSLILPPDTTSGRLLEFFMNAHYSRTQEAEADHGAYDRLLKAKISTAGMAAFFRRLRSVPSYVELLADHPSDESRIEVFEQGAGLPSEPVMSPEKWQALKGACGS